MAILGDSNNIDIQIKTGADTKGIKETENALKGMGAESEKGGISFGKMAAAVAAGQAVFAVAKEAIGAVTGFVRSSVDAYKESENIQTQLNTVLASTHHAAGLQISDLNDQAKALQKTTAYSDEAVGSVQGLLLTFTNLKGPIMKEATASVLDMSTALGEDTKSASIQLGKALNDPIKGITALSRVGVSFTAQQKDTIKSLVESGKTMDAQKIILKELNTEFGGSAVAAGNTYAGSMARLKNQLNDVQESLGKVVIDGLSPFIKKAADFLSAIDWEKDIKKTTLFVKDFWQTLHDGDITSDGLFGKMEHVAAALRNFGIAAKKAYDTIEDYLEPKFIALFHTLEEKVIPQLVKLWKNVIEPLIPVLGTLLVGAIGLAVDGLNFLIDATVSIIGWMEKHKGIVVGLTTVFGALATAMALGAVFDAISVGFATLTLVTIPGFIATLSTIAAPFIAAFPAAIVIAAIAGIGILIAKTYSDLQGLNNAATASINSLNKSMDDSIAKGKLTLDQAYKIQNAAGYTGNKTVYKQGNTYVAGYADGGFTGRGGTNDVAGVVHKGEYVLPQSQVDQSTGQPKQMGTSININAPMYFNTADSVKAFFDMQDRNSLLASKGLSVAR